eukprot:7921263-Pyramimonas_sp.AAC.1
MKYAVNASLLGNEFVNYDSMVEDIKFLYLTHELPEIYAKKLQKFRAWSTLPSPQTATASSSGTPAPGRREDGAAAPSGQPVVQAEADPRQATVGRR